MTLNELITALKRFKKTHPESADMEIRTEGCDCWGDVDRVEPRESIVLLARSIV